ncbi:MAG TPA: flagellar assembly protein FliW [Gemmatimonadaceae bacterium]|jgi:flagellar assembly factor FliW|nr:flagellar assembly protein FliW [Gemmatimonadaceae bacterium]
MSGLTLVNTAEPEFVEVKSDLLGVLRVRTDELLRFPSGLLGFPECRRFALVRAAHEGLFWLQSHEYSTLVFLLVDPFEVANDYSIEIGPSQMMELGPHRPSDVALLAIVTLPATAGERPTANLQGPIAINFATRCAKQVVLSETDYGVRCPIDLAHLKA